MNNRFRRAGWLLAFLAASAALGCGGGPQVGTAAATGGGGSTSSSGAGGQGGESSTSTGATTTTGTGTGGGTGAGGGAPGDGHSGTEIASVGIVATSAKYRMTFSIGDAVQSDPKTTTQKYHLQAGLIGATENLP
jgi:hypothetical protein